jgi:LPS sulfotransferase NodH
VAGRVVRPRASYLICTTPRTGSWLICDALTQTGLAGYPQEYLLSHVAFDLAWGKPSPDSFDDYMAWVCEQATTDNGVCGIKVHWPQMHYLKVVLDLDNCGLLDRLRRHLPGLVLIRLTREDRIRQALSYHRAMTEDAWWEFTGSPIEERDFRPDYAEVARLVGLITRYEQEWDSFVEEVRKRPLTVSYERLVDELAGITRACLRAVGVSERESDAAVEGRRPRLRKQSEDALTADWVEQYNGQSRRPTSTGSVREAVSCDTP